MRWQANVDLEQSPIGSWLAVGEFPACDWDGWLLVPESMTDLGNGGAVLVVECKRRPGRPRSFDKETNRIVLSQLVMDELVDTLRAAPDLPVTRTSQA